MPEALRDENLQAPAAKGFHHAYIGGLLEHTLSTVKLLDLVARHYPTIRRDLEFIGGSRESDSEWTAFHRFFERFIYKGKA